MLNSRFLSGNTLTGISSGTEGFVKTAPSVENVNFNYAKNGKKVPEKVFWSIS